MKTVAVLLPLPLGGAFDYAVPEDMEVAQGDFVVAPLGGREVIGVVWGPALGDVAPDKLKPLAGRLDAPPLPEVSRRFVDWVADYYCAAPGAVMRMTMSVTAALSPPAPIHLVHLVRPLFEAPDVRRTAARERVIDTVTEAPALSVRELATVAGVGTSVVQGLIKAGILGLQAVRPKVAFEVPDVAGKGPRLTEAQEAAAAELRSSVQDGGFSVTLLDGVTGSGKTEVYFEAIAAALAKGRQCLVLLPEIALSPDWLARFKARFGVAPAQWHSDLSAKVRQRTWRAVATGGARVVVGARSALFLPYPDLGLLVVDEEHDAAYKQDDGVCYQARDMAVVRAQLGDIPLVLASATPSMETAVNVARGRYRSIPLPERFGGAERPEIALIDMRQHAPPAGKWLSPPLAEALQATLAAKQQALLFLNRRGYAPLTICRACGHRFECPHCTTWLVEHRRIGRLMCHHCGYGGPMPRTCPSCDAEDQLAACGPGVERAAEEVQALLPEARVVVASSDNLHGPSAGEALRQAMLAGEIDVLVGTQVLAKGHHFPELTLVGVIDADLGLQGGDLRGGERTFQLLTQVSGRAGRAAAAGRAMVQTYMPDHDVMQALVAYDRERFMAVEEEGRRRHNMPPFGRLVAVVVSGRDEAEVNLAAADLGRTAPHVKGPDGFIHVLGPAQAPLALLRGRHRRRLLLHAARSVKVQDIVRTWIGRVKVSSRVRIGVDVDPYNFM